MGKALVTGAAGLIGSHVVDELINEGHEVVALDNLSGGFRDNVNPKARFVEGTILDSVLIGKLFEEYKFEYVFHLAAYAAEGLSPFIRRFNYSNNLLGSVNLINSSINAGTVRCFVFTSSIAVYGAGQLPMSETMIPQPENPYGIAKYAVEMDLKEAQQIFGLNYITFRPHNVYGERQNIADPYRNVIGIFMNQIMKGEPLTIFGDGRQMRAFTYISDVAPIIAQSVKFEVAYNQVFNIGADKPYSVLELAETVIDVMRQGGKIKYIQARNEVQHAYSSHVKLQHHFSDLVRNVNLQDGLQRMADWAKKVGARSARPFNNIEVPINLPPSWIKLGQSIKPADSH